MFFALGTQWNVGQMAVIGLRYESIPVVLRLQRVPRDDWQDVFDAIRTMEQEALKHLNKKR